MDRKKDPNNPEASKEGYIFTHYTYNKSLTSDLKNFSFDVVFMPTTSSLNDDFYNQTSSSVAMKEPPIPVSVLPFDKTPGD